MFMDMQQVYSRRYLMIGKEGNRGVDVISMHKPFQELLPSGADEMGRCAAVEEVP